MFIWLDIETTGLDPKEGVILEVASIITTHNLETVATYEEVIHYDDLDDDTIDTYVLDMHSKNGLWDRVAESLTSPEVIEHRLLGFWKEFTAPKMSPLCGSSVHFDRAWVSHHWPDCLQYLHYRNIDVSTLKELVRVWNGSEEVFGDSANKKHRAIDDLKHSIAELSHYRERFWKAP
jgi:oligoribonuclease